MDTSPKANTVASTSNKSKTTFSSRQFSDDSTTATPQLITQKKAFHSLTNNKPHLTKKEDDSYLPLYILPNKLHFNNIAKDTRYVMAISVRNNTNTAQRIRFQAPKTKRFTINYIPAGNVAPGLGTFDKIFVFYYILIILYRYSC